MFLTKVGIVVYYHETECNVQKLVHYLHLRRKARDVGCLAPVWNLRTVISFHFTLSSLVFLPSPITLSVLSFFCLLAHSPELFQESSSIFFVMK